ncbi:MAG: T9SS type A sorting domain-containing protein [Saprospiraceae bacterium]|nr:T9SS type A sorting domain-containing protein [Saprospiraceae bacterium]
MKYILFILILFQSLSFSIVKSQDCSFAKISNDTFFQDYVEFIYPQSNSDKIITIGSRFVRGFFDDTTFNAPIFEVFDYCGNSEIKIIYKVIDRFRLAHNRIAKSSSYLTEPIGNNALSISNNSFLLVDKASDTLSGEPFLLFIPLNELGNIGSIHSFPITIDEFNFNIKHVLKLINENILIILWDYPSENYYFYYFDKEYNFISKKAVVLPRGVRAIKEISNNEFICTSLKNDSSGFQFYKLSNSLEIEWTVSPYVSYGSARDILIKNDTIYIVGGIHEGGILLISDFTGNVLKEYKINIFPEQRLSGILLGENNDFFLSGYIIHPNSDKRGEDIAIIKLGEDSIIKEIKLFDFRNSSGTSGHQGYYTDFGGFGIAKANDGGIITYGVSKYERTRNGGVAHEDAILIKTEPMIITYNKDEPKLEFLKFVLKSNPVTSSLELIGKTEFIEQCFVYDIHGRLLSVYNQNSNIINVSLLNSGTYILKLLDKSNNCHQIKFVKI